MPFWRRIPQPNSQLMIGLVLVLVLSAGTWVVQGAPGQALGGQRPASFLSADAALNQPDLVLEVMGEVSSHRVSLPRLGAATRYELRWVREDRSLPVGSVRIDRCEPGWQSCAVVVHEGPIDSEMMRFTATTDAASDQTFLLVTVSRPGVAPESTRSMRLAWRAAVAGP